MWLSDISATWGVCNCREACRIESRSDLSTNSSLLDPRAMGLKPRAEVIRGLLPAVGVVMKVPRETVRGIDGRECTTPRPSKAGPTAATRVRTSVCVAPAKLAQSSNKTMTVSMLIL